MKELKTKRLRLVPMTDGELRAAMEAERDPHMKKALSEMLAGCEAAPADRIWYTNWAIELRGEGTAVGSLSFKGPPVKASVELGYGIDEPYRRRGYALEASKAAIDWAFSQEGVYFVDAETEPDNDASQGLLKKLGFARYGEGVEGPRFFKEKPKVVWMAIGMCLGLSVGLSFGAASDSTGTGMCLGLCLGMAVGVLIDGADQKKRAAARAARDLPGDAEE